MSEQRGELDAAWAEAEAATPDGWVWFVGTTDGPHIAHPDLAYSAEAWLNGRKSPIQAFGPTPAAALRALTLKLSAAR